MIAQFTLNFDLSEIRSVLKSVQTYCSCTAFRKSSLLPPISTDMAEILSPIGEIVESGETKFVKHLHENIQPIFLRICLYLNCMSI